MRLDSGWGFTGPWQAQTDASGDWFPGSPTRTGGRLGGIMGKTPAFSSVTEGHDHPQSGS